MRGCAWAPVETSTLEPSQTEAVQVDKNNHNQPKVSRRIRLHHEWNLILLSEANISIQANNNL